MTKVIVTRRATTELDRLIRTHSLPESTRTRVREAIRPLGSYPLLGVQAGPAERGARYILGPWRWMLIVYWFDADIDRVDVLSIEDARRGDSVTAHRG